MDNIMGMFHTNNPVLDINLADHRYRPINVYMQNDAANRKHFINDLEGI